MFIRVRRTLSLLAVLFAGGCSGEPVTVSPTPGNLVIIVSDALRYDVLGCYGGEAHTPNIDWLAANGVRFENAFTNSPWTGPSSVNLLTGSYATSYTHSPAGKTIRIHVPDGEPLVAEVLRRRGYATIAKIENVQAYLHNNLQGFESPGAKRPNPSSDERADLGEVLDRELTGPEAYRQMYAVLETLLRLPADQHFFVFYWMVDPHAPYNAPQRFKDRIDFDRSKLPKPSGHYEGKVDPGRRVSAVEQEYVRKLYVAEVESVDERIGFVLETLRNKGTLEDTYIVFTSDHGEQLGERGKWGHGAWGKQSHYYDVLVRVPLVFYGPGLPRGEVRKSLVSLVDIMPTLTELIGLSFPNRMQGESFAPILFDDRSDDRSVYFTDVRDHEQVDGLREGDLKLIASWDGRFELYDLSKDPDERRNLATEHSRDVERMYEKILAQRAENEKRTSEAPPALPQLTEEEVRKTNEKLKSLGYIK